MAEPTRQVEAGRRRPTRIGSGNGPLFRIVVALGALVVVAAAVLPLWYMVVLSLDPDPVGNATGLVPRRLSLDSYRLLSSPAFGFYPALSRSLVLSVTTTAASLLVAAPAAYALGRLRVPGAAPVLAVLLTMAFFPGVVVVVPLSETFSAIGWLDRLWGIGFAQLSYTVPLAVWFLTYAFRAVPREVEEAALMDGATTRQRLLRVVLPIARPGVAGTTALVFVASWNDFLFSAAFSRSSRSETLPVVLAKLPEIGFLGGQMAAGVLMCLPVATVVAALLAWLSHRDRPTR
ncbi:MAG: carbohydrate ABC transporter permease [Nocardioidaceae bacterium]